MDLKLRRNLPLLLLIVALVAILLLGLGNQPIIAYSIESDRARDGATAIENTLVDVASQFFGLTCVDEAEPTVAAAETVTPAEIGSPSGSAAGADQDQAVVNDPASAGATTAQPDEE